MTETDYQSAVAIIGMSGRFPGASGVSELWRRLLDGMPGLREITDDELRAAGLDPAVTADPAYVRVGGPVDGIDLFDAGVFGFSPRETETMEPQHRLFLECAWEALESAGYCPTEHDVPVGVFAGCGFPDYMRDNLAGLDDEPGGHLLLAAGSERDSLTSLVAYKLGLRGPSVTVQTFCSTSLVAVHMACQSLLTFECDTALAGGAALPLPQPAGYRYEQGGILSPDGTVRSFDAAANGSVMGSGVGVVALKRMTDALADGDVVHAVILGSAVNNDGPARVGYTAPGVEGQAGVIDAALAVADVKPETVGYVECHATGTGLGDAIELTAMNKVFPAGRDTPCVLGSLKPSIGHLDRASGVTGLIRATLAVREHVLPGTPNFETPNPALAAAGDRFTVLSGHRPWPQGPHPRRAGVSSFGLGGTNAHVVLEEAPPRPPLPSRPGPHVLAFSAADPAALEALTVRLRDHLAAHPELRLADVAHTLQQSRGRFALRRAVVCRDLPDAVAALSDPRRLLDGETSRSDAPVRLAVADGVPDAWWSGLASATAALAGQQAPAGAGRETAERLVRELLARLGVRVVTDPAADAVDAVLGDGPAEEWPAAALARLWLAGVRVDWSALHRDADGTPTAYRVELPTYPFQRRRYWTDTRPAASPAAGDAGTTGSAVRRVDDTGAWTYLPTWRQEPVPAGDLDARLRAAGPWLVLSGDARGEALIARLARAGAETTAVRLADGFDMDDTGDFTVGPRPADDLPEVFGSLLVAPRTVVHAWSLAAPPDGQTADAGPMAVFEAAQELGFHSALALAGALADSPAGGETELVLLTSGATGVTGADLTRPEHASLAALAPSLAQENPALRCRSIDVDAPPLPAAGDAAGVLADRLAGHVLAAAVAPHRGPLAVRAGETWLRHYEPVRLDTPARPLFREGETVLITGGLGDVGLTLARHLAQTYRCRLVLTTRGALPPREEWPLHADGESRTARHVRNLLDLEERGAEVLAVSADVADLEQMRRAVTLAVERFGGIDAVVHGAGVQDPAYFRAAHLSDREMCAAHFRAKVGGFHVLQEVLAGHCPERRLTLSSIAAVLGGIALGPYAAANAALDAFARAARRDGAGVWTSVDWDTWGVDPARFDGELVMRPHEGVDVFERALAAGDRIGQVVVSTASLRARLDQWVTGAGRPAGQPMQERRERHPRPQLSTPYAEPADELEASLAEVWASVLGLDRVGADDNFFELGGHSLLAIQVAGRIRETVRAGLPVTAIVEHPTVRELAAGLRES